MSKDVHIVENLFGLIGKNISYSFSKAYFTEKFKTLGLMNYGYENFDIPMPENFLEILQKHPNLKGLNVTIPYKESLMPYLSETDPVAKTIGAVNTIKITTHGPVGCNTDWYGFQQSIQPLLAPHHKKALILGTGGASKAVAYVFSLLNIAFTYVSRTAGPQSLTYKDLSPQILQEYTVMVNCSPVGTFPDTEACPDLPYFSVSDKHLFYDLIYNPLDTKFLKLARAQGAVTINGLKMLELQAEKSWQIWRA